MKVCDCYRQLEPIQLMVGECLGAKNKPRVDCCGDERHCLFYSDRRKAKAVTNADRIRAMSDEELAEWLGQYGERSFACTGLGACDCQTTCRECWLDWLRQEVTDDP